MQAEPVHELDYHSTSKVPQLPENLKRSSPVVYKDNARVPRRPVEGQKHTPPLACSDPPCSSFLRPMHLRKLWLPGILGIPESAQASIPPVHLLHLWPEDK